MKIFLLYYAKVNYILSHDVNLYAKRFIVVYNIINNINNSLDFIVNNEKYILRDQIFNFYIL